MKVEDLQFRDPFAHYSRNRLRALKDLTEMMDDNILYGRPFRSVNVRGERPPSARELNLYRRNHLSARCRREIERLLSQRGAQRIDASDDIVLDPADDPWSAEHKELALRSRCFALLSLAKVHWIESQEKEHGLFEGWLLIEDGRIVGAVDFERQCVACNDGTQARQWIWRWAFIDPEQRRKGCLSRRLSLWEKRYGHLVVDQPNDESIAMLRKAGFAERVLIRERIPGAPISSGAGLVVSLDIYERLYMHGRTLRDLTEPEVQRVLDTQSELERALSTRAERA